MDKRKAIIERALENIQLEQVSQEAATCGSDRMRERLRARKIFYEQLRHSNGDDLETLLTCAKTAECFAGIPPHPSYWDDWRQQLSSLDVRYTDADPPDMIYLMVSALALLKHNLPEESWCFTIILSTDCTHHPRGSVTLIAKSCYEIRFSRYFLLDIGAMGDLIYNAISDAREKGGQVEFSQFVSSDSFVDHFKISRQEAQMPYVLLALALGGKFRYGHYGTMDPVHGAERHVALHKLCVCFLLGHELSHLLGAKRLRIQGKQIFAPYFDPRDEKCEIAHVELKTLQDYWSKFGLKHAEEVAADWRAFDATGDAAVDLVKSRHVGLVASVLTLNVIAWMDRANHFMDTHKDPLAEAAHEKSIPKGLIDVKLQRSHPWGLTRLMLCQDYLFAKLMTAPEIWTKSWELEVRIVSTINLLFRGEIEARACTLLALGRLPGVFFSKATATTGKLQLVYVPELASPEYNYELEIELENIRELWSIFRPLSSTAEGVLSNFRRMPPTGEKSAYRDIARLLGLDRQD